MPKDTELNIKKLVNNEKYFICIYSGRPLEEIKNHLKLPNVTYAGCHGLEVEYPNGKKFMIEMPEELLNKHKQLVEELKEKVVLHGAWVEDKKISVTYRYKGVNDKLKAKLVEDAKAIIKTHGFQIIETPYALEGKPRVNWDKGRWYRYRFSGIQRLLKTASKKFQNYKKSVKILRRSMSHLLFILSCFSLHWKFLIFKTENEMKIFHHGKSRLQKISKNKSDIFWGERARSIALML